MLTEPNQTIPPAQGQPQDEARALNDLMSAIAALGPLVRSERSRIDQERRLSGELTDALLNTGVCRIFTPREYDGLELIEALQTLLPGVAIIAVSGKGPELLAAANDPAPILRDRRGVVRALHW